MKKITWAFIGSIIWAWLGIGATNLSNTTNHIQYSDYSIGNYIGTFIVIATPLIITTAYYLKKRGQQKSKVTNT